MDQGTLQGIGTILTMIAFLGVCWWAYSGRKKKDFDEAAQLPFVDDTKSSQDEDK
ncbi:MAG: cbb3-type cytochrome c oxidase subunit 3 [Porticoccus sp.]|jgi:cytochrome c oxidase cbb3-type subunit IV|uniref:cbb3-type cytochrome oxidase subunit 3 n=1 Tax=Porticoccus hydrocarbonoclasticus TaxID=1073414 RepID=UPI0009DFF77C|nr:cbb3-type cytochrome c oxidase subunit 3 [Porticoccus hydrocarbonoclasticus]MBG58152.1 cbb3-type cytochrome c oxidase subunit 3 [Porticoccus sp.]|tara:strand:+ start:211 stop:375 length:165 start_codon:yes stop_codon:yes gene_type:complete